MGWYMIPYGFTICLLIVNEACRIQPQRGGITTLVTYKLYMCSLDTDMVIFSIPMTSVPLAAEFGADFY